MVIYAPQINNSQAYAQNSMYNVGYNASYNNNIGAYNNNMTSIFNNNNNYQNYNTYQNNNTYNNIALPANNTTNIFNSFLTQPSAMTPQASPQIIVAVPTATAPQQQPVEENKSSSNETAMKFLLLMMSMLLGKTNKTDETSETNEASTTDNTDGKNVVIEDNNEEMTDLKAAKILMNNFDKIEVIDDPKADNVATWTEMGKYYAQTTDDEYKKAYEYFQSNQDVFTYIETLMGKENADWKNPDNQVNKRELVEFISSKSE